MYEVRSKTTMKNSNTVPQGKLQLKKKNSLLWVRWSPEISSNRLKNLYPGSLVILDPGLPDFTLTLVLLEQEETLGVLQLRFLYTYEVYLCNVLIIPIFSPVVTISDQGGDFFEYLLHLWVEQNRISKWELPAWKFTTKTCWKQPWINNHWKKSLVATKKTTKNWLI